jgi:DNA-binding MarR family transcriptional regulator
MTGQRASDAAERTGAPSMDDIAELATTFSQLMRTFIRARHQFLAKAKHSVEWSAHVLMAAVVNDGPLRAGALAEIVQSDASTVSRQVAQLVKDGYLERQADPADGRASLLAATERGLELHREHLQVRDEHFRRMLEEWGERDIRRFSALLCRFTADYEKNRATWLQDDPARDAASRASQREI